MKLTATQLPTTLLPGLVAVAALFAATPALADSITLDSGAIGKSYTFTYDGFSGGTAISGLTASTTFTPSAISGNDYIFAYSLANTTSDPLSSRVSSFGFNTNPDITSATSTGTFSYTTLDSSYPNGIGAIDVCFKDAATRSCSGGGKGGVLDGATGAGAFTLSFAQPVTSLTLSDFYLRYQSISGAGCITSASGAGTLTGSSGGTTTGGTTTGGTTTGGTTTGGTTTGGTTTGGTTTGGTTTGGAVPEPGMLALFALGLLGLFMARKRLPLARAAD